jgi:hypothetical protein
MSKFNSLTERFFIILLLILLVSGKIYGGNNVMKLDSLQAFPGSTINVMIFIENDDPFVSFQLDMPIPEGFTYIQNSAQLNPDRKVNHTIATNVLANNRLRIISYSMTNAPFLGNSGAVAWFQMETPSNTGVHLLELLNVTIGSPNNQNIVTGTVNGAVNLMAPLLIEANCSPDEICQNQSVQLSVMISGGGWFPVIYWTSQPEGFYSNLPDPVDFPEVSTTYYVTVDDGHQNASDTGSVIVQPAPLAYAGENQVINAGDVVITSQATAYNYTSFIWTTTGDGIFSNPFELNTEYYPGEEDIDNGQVLLELTAYGNYPCEEHNDTMEVYILGAEDNYMISHGGEAFLFSTLEASVEIINVSEIASFHCIIELPQSVQYVEGSGQLTGRASDHILETSVIDGNRLVMDAFSPNNHLFSGNDGDVITYSIYTGGQSGVYPLPFTEASIFNQAGENILTRTYDGQITLLISNVEEAFIRGSEARVYPQPAHANSILEFEISNPGLIRLEVYDLHARSISSFETNVIYTGLQRVRLGEMLPSFDSLPSGIYICVVKMYDQYQLPLTVKFFIQ